jgi:hypothetical protein
MEPKKLSRVYLHPWAAPGGKWTCLGEVTPGADGIMVVDRESGRVQFFSWPTIFRIDYDFAP